MTTQAALDISRLAHNIYLGSFSYMSILSIATHEDAHKLIPPILHGQLVPIGEVKSKYGGSHTFDFKHFLEQASADPFMIEQLKTIWFTGSLSLLGDVLAKQNYFDKAPILQLVRHMRNGISHGNVFKIEKPGNLQNFPANNFAVTDEKSKQVEITPALEGKRVLFEFIEPAELLNLFQGVQRHLEDIAKSYS